MKITNISYEKCHNLGNYEHEKIRLDAEVSEGDDVAEAMTTLRTIVDADIKTADDQRRMAQALRHGEFCSMKPDSWYRDQNGKLWFCVEKADAQVLVRNDDGQEWKSPIDVEFWYSVGDPTADGLEDDEHVTDDDEDYDPMAEE